MISGQRTRMAALFLVAPVTLVCWLGWPPFFAHATDPIVARDAIDAWVRDKGLKMGVNRSAEVFVVRGFGKNRLECLVSAVAKLARHLDEDVAHIEETNRSSIPTRVFIQKSVQHLRGYQIETESLMSQQFTLTNQKPDNQSRDSLEVISLVKKDGVLLCAAFHSSDGEDQRRSFYPSIATARRQTIEDELMKTFVRDCFVHSPDESGYCQSVFVLDCKSR